MTYHPVSNRSNTEGANSGTETTHLSGAHEFTPIFIVGSLFAAYFMGRISKYVLIDDTMKDDDS
jgi:hypothetical protein